ncbi:hypothetical protein CTI12_AA143700 [Artemisia annua]|uniref:Integrase catalytic domain-containing protein n=1 Tax=Artemisia annua TaxID=35608 RepID=A0A2U1PKE8_ARTAN|nr:hypothetical protein CTI12_AA143700 [Artemisia annua]
MEAYFRKVESLVTILTSLDSHVNDEDVVHYVLEGLLNKYDQVCGIMHHKDTFPDLKTARTMPLTEEMRLKSKALAFPMDSSYSSPMILMAELGTSRRPSNPQVKSWRPCYNFAKGAVNLVRVFKCVIKPFLCDHGGEFDNRNLHKLFAVNGIQCRFSCPKISQQNGMSERMPLVEPCRLSRPISGHILEFVRRGAPPGQHGTPGNHDNAITCVCVVPYKSDGSLRVVASCSNFLRRSSVPIGITKPRSRHHASGMTSGMKHRFGV